MHLVARLREKRVLAPGDAVAAEVEKSVDCEDDVLKEVDGGAEGTSLLVGEEAVGERQFEAEFGVRRHDKEESDHHTDQSSCVGNSLVYFVVRPLIKKFRGRFFKVKTGIVASVLSSAGDVVSGFFT